ncbi:HAD family hydrolase [uncultured Jatrophihabitans sp.]|uniref:HAD family hydrolase n=1 Tax=uncultured Jatrophihabitans sp. TaxID=1610747 RepID=UPI0035CAFF50
MANDQRGILFDVDGTLVDTTFLHTVCWAEALRQHGLQVTASDIHHGIGMSSDKMLAHLLGEDRDTSADDAISEAHDTLYKLSWGRLTTLPGAADLLRECAKRGFTVVLASSASEQELQVLRETIDADDAVAQATSKNDAKSGKPAPDIVETALDSSGLAADRAVFVGDAVWDAEAAKKAGVTFIGLTCGGTPEADLRAAGAVEVWRDPADLLEHFADSIVAKA